MRAPPTPFAAALALILAAGCLSCVDLPAGDDGSGETGGPQRVPASVVEVVDGDTIRVRLDGSEVPVRLIGIDTPERDGPFTDEECFGSAASRFTDDLVGGREVGLEFDLERVDRFDRTLAYVWLGDELVNERLVLDGYAVLATFPPNVRYVDRLTAAQARARDDGAGLWGACPR